MEDKSLVWIHSGGIGNIVMRTSILPELREKYGDEIYMICPYADIWELNDTNSYATAPSSLYEQLIKDNENCDVIAENPYNNSDFIKKNNLHFNDAVRDLFGLPRKGTEECMKENPNIPVAKKHPEVVEDVKRFLDQQKHHKFILIQNTGGQSPLDPNTQIQGPEPLVRNYKWMEELVAKLQEKYKGYTFIQYKLPNEKLIEGCVSIERPYLWYRVLGEVLAEDKDNFAIAIDSSLQHILAGTGLNTTVLWGETRPEHFGHSCHHNVDFAKNDLTKCEPYFQLFQNKPSVIRFKKPDELLEELLVWLPEVKEKK